MLPHQANARRFPGGSVAIVLLVALTLGADSPDGAARRLADKQALAKLQELVGEWRGAGQPKRGSSEGAWVERGQWAWKFTADSATLDWSANTPRFIESAVLRPGTKPGQFLLTATMPKSSEPIHYAGQLQDDGALVLAAPAPGEGRPDRITIRIVARGDRLVTLYERRSNLGEGFTRLAEVGYTRQGSQFGKGTTYPECVVTGGHGTISVTFEGKNYQVCCTGCRDIFEKDPAGVLAEYRARKKKEADERKMP